MKAWTYCVRLTAVCIFIAALTGCAKKVPPPPPPPKKPAAVRVQKPVDPKAQQQYYDLGIKYYTEENYKQAKKLFKQAIQSGPTTTLGIKARENLKKTEQILRTLKEMESDE